MFKFSCADYTFPVMTRSAALHLVKLLGLDYVDIGLFARSSHFSPLDLQASPQTYTRQMLEDLKAAGLRASDLFLQIGVDPSECSANDPDSAVRGRSRETFAHAIEFCVALGCSHLTGLPGVYHASLSRERSFEVAAEESARRVAECAKAGIRYAVEPHIDSICADVESARRFVGAVDGLTLTLDYGHFIVTGADSTQVHELLPFASHIHVRGGALDQLQASLEESTIDFQGMLKHLQSLGYDGFLALEYVWVNWKNCNRTDNVSETLLLRHALESSASLVAAER